MLKRSSAFTLIELLVVISIIAVLAGVLLPVFSSVQTAGRKVQSLSNMRQLGAALILYCGQYNGQLPTEGESAPTWSSAAATTDANNTAWYNALPRLGNFPAVSDYATNQAGFYTKANLLFVPAAMYPTNKLVVGSYPGPLFAVSFCSKFYGTIGGVTADPSQIRLVNFQQPSHTVIFQESGVPGETMINASQSAYNGQPKSFASRSIARYAGKTVLVFADGHADSLFGTDIVAPGGKAYAPQSLGKVFWTMDPGVNPNS